MNRLAKPPLFLRGGFLCALIVLTAAHGSSGQFKFREPPNRQDPSPLSPFQGMQLWNVFLNNRTVGHFVIEGALVFRPAQAASTSFSFALTGEWYPGNEYTRVILGMPGKEPVEREVAFREGRWVLPDQGVDPGTNPSTGEGMNKRIHGNLPFTWMDLLMPYLQWPDIRYAGPDRHLGRPSQTYELRNPDPDAFPSRVVVSLDEDFAAILASDFYDADGFLSRRMRVAGFKRYDGQWMFSQISWEDRKARSSVRLEVYSFSNTK